MSSPSGPPLDRDRGLVLLGWFLFATVVMVGVVLVAGAVGEMWILVPGIGIHLLMTFFVLHAIVRLMSDGR
jgi:hypothetical protein